MEDSESGFNIVNNEVTSIAVKNDDPNIYKVHWQLMDGGTICEGDADLDPKSSAVLRCKPQASWRFGALAGAIKPDALHDGYRLLLLPRPIQKQPSESALEPLISFKTRGSFGYYGPQGRGAIKYLTIFLLLTLGGITSLALSYYIPNKLLRLNLVEKLMHLAAKTSDLSSRIESRLAVIVRLERSRLTDLLQTRGVFSPDFAAVASQRSIGIERLTAKVGILEQMDTVLGVLERQTKGVPPTRVDQIHEALNDAKVVLNKSEISDDDIRTAKSSVDLASKQVNSLDSRDDELGENLHQTANKLRKVLPPCPPPLPTVISAHL